jgi:hypothetical protein
LREDIGRSTYHVQHVHALRLGQPKAKQVRDRV